MPRCWHVGHVGTKMLSFRVMVKNKVGRRFNLLLKSINVKAFPRSAHEISWKVTYLIWKSQGNAVRKTFHVLILIALRNLSKPSALATQQPHADVTKKK